MRAIGSNAGLGVKVTARRIRWTRDKEFQQWIDQTYGFCVWADREFKLPACAVWDGAIAAEMLKGSNEAEKRFATIAEAKEWCQKQADRWIAIHAVLTPRLEL